MAIAKKTTAKKTATKKSTTAKPAAKKTTTTKKTATYKTTSVNVEKLGSDNLIFKTFDTLHTAMITGFYAHLSGAYEATTIIFPKTVSRYGKQYKVDCMYAYTDFCKCKNLKSIKLPKSYENTPTLPSGVKIIRY
ncbi:MAG: hypothetical protein J6Q47_02910 [Paludibacteraceae bacterium]|nr:hypothetical protein [Paludibacteraceae bacterium]